MNISIDLIDRDPEQPRTVFDDAAIDDLAASMAASGQAVAILVRPVGERYMIVHGERRWRAAQRLGWRELRAEVQDVSADDAPWLALVENVQRADLTPIEEAHAYQKMIDAGHTQSEIGRRLGKTQSFVAQKLRLLKLRAAKNLKANTLSVLQFIQHSTILEGRQRDETERHSQRARA